MRPSQPARKSIVPPRPRPISVPIPRPAAPPLFVPNAAQRRLLDIIHCRPSVISICDLCISAGIPRRTYYSWCQNPGFRLWLATAWSARLLMDGSALLNIARFNATSKFSYWKALFDLTFDPKGLGYLQKWQQAVAAADSSLFDLGPGEPPPHDPPAPPPPRPPDPNESPLAAVKRAVEQAMLANSEALVRPIPLHDPLDPPPAALVDPEAVEQVPPQQNQSHKTISCTNRPYPHHVAGHYRRCLRSHALRRAKSLPARATSPIPRESGAGAPKPVRRAQAG